MELKIKVNAITIKDESSGEKHTVKTVRTAKEIWEYLEGTETEALNDQVADLATEY